tara:strand:- start:510 stop:686 length:177 start_codon:yes stop_codon:yes gene_type:complete
MFKKFLFYCSFCSLIVFYACEDDPLLAPQSGEEEGGSYATTSFSDKQEETENKNPTVF